jgi:hypothetical protein
VHSPESIFADGSRVIATQFDLDMTGTNADTLELRENAFRSRLIERIVALLSGNTERLMHILYRVDVPEPSIAAVFRETPLPDIAPAIADLIIERQMAKARTRAEYRDRMNTETEE